MKKLKYFNMNIALKILLLLSFAFFFVFTIFTGSISMYVHPRIIPYMVFASFTMTIIALLLSRKLLEPVEKRENSIALFIFVIPLVMAFALPADYFDSSSAMIGEVQLALEKNISENNFEMDSNLDKVIENIKTVEDVETVGETVEFQDDKNETLIMDSDNFYEYISGIYSDMDSYIGRSIEVVGFVFKGSESFSNNEFVPARLMMVCCAADMQPVGLLCTYDKTSELEIDSWVKVKGVIEAREFDGEMIPQILAQSVEKIQEPDKSYVYPY